MSAENTPENPNVLNDPDIPEGFTVTKEVQTEAPAAPVSDAPDTATPLGWMPESFIGAWVTKHADEYVMAAEADFSNGRTVALLLHPETTMNKLQLESAMYQHALKKPGTYFQRLSGKALTDTPVFKVFMTKDRVAPPRIPA